MGVLRLTNGNCSPPCSGGSGSVRLGRLKAPTPHSTTFCKPCKHFVFAYSGLQNVSYLERYAPVYPLIYTIEYISGIYELMNLGFRIMRLRRSRQDYNGFLLLLFFWGFLRKPPAQYAPALLPTC